MERRDEIGVILREELAPADPAWRSPLQGIERDG